MQIGQRSDAQQLKNQMQGLVRVLDMNNQGDMLLATQPELQKCKYRNPTISENAINQVYAQAASIQNIVPTDAYELMKREIDGVQNFKTGVEE